MEILHLLLSSRRPRRVFHILNKNLEFQNFTSIRNVKVKKITYILTKKGYVNLSKWQKWRHSDSKYDFNLTSMNIMEPCYYRIFLEKVDVIQLFSLFKRNMSCKHAQLLEMFLSKKISKPVCTFYPFFYLYYSSTTF